MERSDMEKNNETEADRAIVDHIAILRAQGDWQPDLRRGLGRLRERRAANSRHKWKWAWITAGAVAACLPLMAFPITRAFAERCVSACVKESGAVRQLLLGNQSSPVPAGASGSTYVKPEDRRMAPDFTLTGAAGQRVTLSEAHGKVVLLNFWATWCAPCKQEIPWFIGFQRAWRDRGFTVLGVSMDQDGWSAVKPFVDATHVNYAVAIGNDEVAGLYGAVNSLPVTVIIDRSGRIAAVHVGLCRKDEYEADINAVLNEDQGRETERTRK
jgi:peroxiredoxin